MKDDGISKAGGKETSPEEVARLKAENEALKAQTAKLSKREKRGGFWRRFTVWLLIILACIFSVLGVLSVWLKTTTLDTSTFVNTVAPLVKDPEVAKAVSDTAAKELFKQYDVTGQIKAGLTDISNTIREVAPNLPHPDISLSAIAAPISNGLQSFASKTAQKILTSDAFYKVWSESLRIAHTAAVNILTGNSSKVITSQGNTVVLNLAPLLDQVKTKLADAGLSFLNKVQVPANFGQIKLFTSEQLGVAKGMVHLLETLSWVLPLLAFIFFVLAIVIAKDKRKALLWEGIGLAIAMLVVLIVFRVAHNQLFGMIKHQENLAAADVIWWTILTGLRQAVFGLLALGVVVAIGAGVAGPSRWAVWTREHVGDFFANWRERREGKKGKTEFMAFMDKYAWWFRVGGLVVAVLFLVLLPHVSGLAVILTVVVLLVYLAVIEVLR
jgi:hypothetical protein